MVLHLQHPTRSKEKENRQNKLKERRTSLATQGQQQPKKPVKKKQRPSGWI